MCNTITLKNIVNMYNNSKRNITIVKRDSNNFIHMYIRTDCLTVSSYIQPDMLLIKY